MDLIANKIRSLFFLKYHIPSGHRQLLLSTEFVSLSVNFHDFLTKISRVFRHDFDFRIVFLQDCLSYKIWDLSLSHYLIPSGREKINSFPKGICAKVNTMNKAGYWLPDFTFRTITITIAKIYNANPLTFGALHMFILLVVKKSISGRREIFQSTFLVNIIKASWLNIKIKVYDVTKRHAVQHIHKYGIVLVEV